MAEQPAVDGFERRTVLRRVTATVGGVSGVAGCLSSGGQSSAGGVRSRTHVHRAATSAVAPSGDRSTPPAGVDEYALQEGGVRWGSFPVETVVGVSTVPDSVSTAAARAAIAASFETWNGVSDVGAVFAPPTFDDTLTDVTRGNGTNEFVWSTLDDDSLGRATIRWDEETELLEEVDIRLNRERAWSTDPVTGDTFDVQSLATHEIGHHGLDDVTDADAAEQTMYHETSAESTRKRTPESGDVVGWQTVYGDVA